MNLGATVAAKGFPALVFICGFGLFFTAITPLSTLLSTFGFDAFFAGFVGFVLMGVGVWLFWATR